MFFCEQWAEKPKPTQDREGKPRLFEGGGDSWVAWEGDSALLSGPPGSKDGKSPGPQRLKAWWRRGHSGY